MTEDVLHFAGGTSARKLRKIPVGMSLGIFLSLTLVLCVLFDLWLPVFARNYAWSALLFGGLYNFRAARGGIFGFSEALPQTRKERQNAVITVT